MSFFDNVILVRVGPTYDPGRKISFKKRVSDLSEKEILFYLKGEDTRGSYAFFVTSVPLDKITDEQSISHNNSVSSSLKSFVKTNMPEFMEKYRVFL